MKSNFKSSHNIRTFTRCLVSIGFLLLILSPTSLRAQVPDYPNPVIIYNSSLACQLEEPKQGVRTEDPGPCLKVCEFSTESYSVNANPSSTYQWSVSGGAIVGSSTGTSVNVTWGQHGRGTLSVTEYLADAYNTADLCIEIVSSPRAKFTIPPAEDHVFCVNQEVTFLDISTIDFGTIVSWSWDFGDGTYSHEQNPTHHWNLPGTYSVMLTVYNECHCSGQFQYDVFVEDGVPVTISCLSVACENQRTSYTADIECGDQWYVTGGHITNASGNMVEVLWDDPSSLIDGFGFVAYSVQDCPEACSQFVTVRVPVIQENATISGEANVCANKQYHYSLPAWPATIFEWQVDNTSRATIVDPKDKDIFIDFLSDGVVTLSARYYNTMTHCSGTASLTINILPPSTIASTLPIGEPACQGSSATFSRMAGSTAISSNWTVELPDGSTQSASGGSFSVSFPLPGTYVVSATGGNFCAADPVTVHVLPKPDAPAAIVGENYVCRGQSYEYTVQNYDPSLRYIWSFANPADGYVLNTDGGTATVVWNRTPATLQVQAMLPESPFCTSDCATLEGLDPNTATYTIAMVAGSNPCTKTFELRRNGLPFLSASNYEWELDFNTPSTFASIVSSPYNYQCEVASHLITSPQTCIVRCNYWICNVWHIVETQATFGPVPAPVVTPSSPQTVCSDTPVTFAVANSADYSSITWFHEGEQSGGSTYTATFHNNSSSIVTENVTVVCATSCGSQFSTVVSVQVHPAIQASLIYNDLNKCLIVDYDPSQPYTFSWSLGETLLPDVTPYYNIPTGQYGDYACTISVNGCNLVLTYQHPNKVPGGEDCSGRINPSLAPCGSATLHVIPNTFSSVLWTSYSPYLSIANTNTCTTSCTATRAGSYAITASVAGPPCDAVFSAQIEANLVADYNIRYICINNTPHVYLENNSTCYPYGGTISTVVSINGIGTPVTCPCDLTAPPFGFQPGQTYSFTATATTTNPDGSTTSCSQSFTITLPDHANATFSLSPAPVCVNNPITLTPANTTFPSYSWKLSGAASNRVSEIRSFSDVNSYNISLSVVDLYGCNASSTQQVVVYENNLVGEIDYDHTPVCLGTPVNLKYLNRHNLSSSTLNTFSYTWTPNASSTSPYYAITVTDPTLYTLIVRDGYGCEFHMGPDGANIVVPEPPVISGRLDICPGEPVTLRSICGDHATMTNNTYQWYCDGNAIAAPMGTQCDLIDYHISSSSPASHTFRLEVTYAGSGCAASSSVTVTEHPRPATPTIDPNPAYSCNPYAVDLQVANIEPLGTYCWSNGASGPAVSVPEGGVYNVTYISPFGCKATSDDIVIARSPESYFWTFPTGCYVMCPGDTLQVHGPAKFWDNNIWKWEFLDYGTNIAQGDRNYPGLDNYGLDPHLVITGAGSYEMALSNGHCAETVGTANVTLAPSCYSCSIFIEFYEFCLKPDGTVVLNLVVLNNEPIPLNYSLVLDDGLVYTAHGTLQPGPNAIAPILVPYGVVSVGDLLTGRIIASNPDPDVMRCYADFEYPVTECGKAAGLVSDSTGLGSIHAGAPFDFKLSPNPTRGGAYASFSGVSGSHVCVCVIDMKGQEMLRRDVAEGEQKVFLEVNSLPRGAYMVCLVGDGEPLSCLKLIKQ